ncbi:MAG: glycosyltransferase family 4 protein, partial [Syntrophales bacterium]|nr:glycosyltransferase family 4 protein [Syntrophales bacterium]
FDIKGLDRLITALAVLKSELPNEKFKLLVVGKGTVGKYKGLAARLDIADRVIFTGVLEKAKLDKAYLASDIFSILSRFDTFGMVVLEAMAASLPVIVSSNVGAKDIVREGVNGFIINEEDTAKISGKIALLLDRERRLSMGREAHATALACTWEKRAKSVEDIYETAIGKGLKIPLPPPLQRGK